MEVESNADNIRDRNKQEKVMYREKEIGERSGRKQFNYCLFVATVVFFFL